MRKTPGVKPATHERIAHLDESGDCCAARVNPGDDRLGSNSDHLHRGRMSGFANCGHWPVAAQPIQPATLRSATVRRAACSCRSNSPSIVMRTNAATPSSSARSAALMRLAVPASTRTLSTSGKRSSRSDSGACFCESRSCLRRQELALFVGPGARHGQGDDAGRTAPHEALAVVKLVAEGPRLVDDTLGL